MRPQFRRVLIANRGEIAVRLSRGLAELGIEPVVVYSDVDRHAAHVVEAQHAVALGGTTAAESYLRIDKILEVARAAGAEAIHPGYGFLSENADFAQAVTDAGLVFIGPTAAAMRQLGSKSAARQVAEAAGVPIVPGFHSDDGDDRRLLAAAERIGFPLLIKATAGGGGKGMRLVEHRQDFADALGAARREAKVAFGDDRVLLEKRVFPARHIEIQILGDQHGKVVSLHERECSVQRRHQKVLEEAPSPAVDEALRQRMGLDAIKLAQRAGYSNAGTCEFLLGADGSYYFLEVNARLQVEHPVTELVTGLDLVHLQLAVARGAKLDELLAGRDLRPRGWAIEVRLCAEDPTRDFLPAAGTLQRVIEPHGPGIRVDSGVYPGVEIPVHYDPLLSKLIVHAPDRLTACRRMAAALERVSYLGIPTNLDLLRRLVEDPDFVAGRLRTDFLALKPELLHGADGAPPDAAYIGAALVHALAPRGAKAAATTNGVLAAGAWQEIGPLRLWETAR